MRMQAFNAGVLSVRVDVVSAAPPNGVLGANVWRRRADTFPGPGRRHTSTRGSVAHDGWQCSTELA
jgi:hypothetical protein